MLPIFMSLIILLIGGALSAVLLAAAGKSRRRLHLVEETPLSTVAGVKNGRVKLSGQAVALGPLLQSPMTGIPCIYYRFTVREKRVLVKETRAHFSGKPGETTRTTETVWQDVVEDRQNTECGLRDQTGLAEINLHEAEVNLGSKSRFKTSRMSGCPPELQRMLRERYGKISQVSLFAQPLLCEETALKQGDPMLVLGEVRLRPGKSPLIAKPHSESLLVSDRGDAEMRRHYRLAALISAIGSGATAIGTSYLCFLAMTWTAREPVPRPAAGLGDHRSRQALISTGGINGAPEGIQAEATRPRENRIRERRAAREAKPADLDKGRVQASAIVPDPAPAPIQVRANIDRSPPIPFQDHLIFPSFPHSAVVGFVPPGRDRNRLLFYDLGQMQRLGGTVQPVGKIGDYMHLALSPDGAYLAGVERADGSTVQVWSTSDGRSLRRFRSDSDPKMKVGRVDFAGKGRLLTMKHRGLFPLPEAEATYQIWDLGSGTELVHFTFPLVYDPRWAAISPGGRYLVMEQTAEGYHIVFWDLTTGKLANTFDFQAKSDQWGQAAGMSFTPDGERLAMLWRLGRQFDSWARLFSWEVRTGKQLHNFPIDYVHADIYGLWVAGGTRCLQWVPDGSGWLLFGHLLIDEQSGAVVRRIGPEPTGQGNMMNRRFLSSNLVTSINKKQFTVEVLKRSEQGDHVPPD
jgi:hypothetical protein